MTYSGMRYGVNTPKVLGFLALLGTLDANQRMDVFMRDATRLPRFSSRRAQWSLAYDAVIEGLRQTKRMGAAGEAWLAVKEVLGNSSCAETARWVVDAIVADDLLTQEQREILYYPFLTVAPDLIWRAA